MTDIKNLSGHYDRWQDLRYFVKNWFVCCCSSIGCNKLIMIFMIVISTSIGSCMGKTRSPVGYCTVNKLLCGFGINVALLTIVVMSIEETTPVVSCLRKISHHMHSSTFRIWLELQWCQAPPRSSWDTGRVVPLLFSPGGTCLN